jgi:8-oxo-dGTP pyrophosphatase MutT (NUDIX family)
MDTTDGPDVSMLFFYRAPKARFLELAQNGLGRDGAVFLWTAFAPAAAGKDPVLVIDRPAVEALAEPAGPDGVHVPGVPAAAFLNLSPYRPTRCVSAAGGYVVREGPGGPELLLIRRLGVWDLPKGKREDGETVEDCARREVCEEVGIRELCITRPLGTTLHGYVRKNRFDVKRTFWYRMETPERDFTPQTDEAIEAVAWMPVREAAQALGYESLRRHLAAVLPLLEAW